jgi:uncharacterized protein
MVKKWLKRVGYTLLLLFVLLNVMAAFHAYKFTHFYTGIPKPQKPEELSFGDKASAIFFGIKFPKSIVVDSFTLNHQTITITTNDGMQLEAWYAKDSITPLTSHIHNGTVILFHGHGGNKNGVMKEAEYFFSLGYSVLLVDFRAHGNSQGNTCTIGVDEAQDVKAAYDFIAAEKESNIVLWGISLGAASIMKAIDAYNLKPSKVILEMPFGSLQDAVKGRVKMMGLPQQPISGLLTFWGGVEQGFWAFNHKPWNYAKKIYCPTLLQWGINDNRVTAYETNTIFANLAAKEKALVKYEFCSHESLCKKEPEKWKAAVQKFLNQ